MAPGDARRDRWGRYLVVPPEGGRPVGYTRATTIAKALDDQGGLMPWKASLALTGVMRRPGLRATLEALISQHPHTGPWYGSTDAKKAMKELVEEAAVAGGSADRADLGTALHAIVEQINLGQTPTITQAETRADVDAYLTKICAAGITFDPDYIECTYVLDEYRIAGTADMGRAHVPGLGHVIADLKTGSNLAFSWQSIAVQLAIYARGDALYAQGLADDGSGDVRHDPPEVRQDVAVVIHLPAGEARCDLYEVDIAAGWEAFKQSIWVREWRARKNLAKPLEVQPARATLDNELLGLLTLARSLPAEQAAQVKAAWPAGAPALTVKDGWTPQLLDQVAALLADATQKCGSPGVDVTAAAVTATPLSGGEEAAPSTSRPSTNATADPPGDHTLTAAEFEQLSHAQQADLIARGHLPDELRAHPDDLADYKARLKDLTEAQLDWLVAQARLIGLPNLGHPHRWTVHNAEELARLLDAAEVLTDQADVPAVVVPDWVALVAAAGVTKAATLRKAKELGAALGVKVPSSVARLPQYGPLAEQLAAWLTERAEQDAA